MKLKIRKVEVTSEEFFEALSSILTIHEKIPKSKYVGSSLEYICRSIGIKTLEFWKLKFENEEEFEKLFVVLQAGFNSSVFYLWRKETYEINQQEIND